MPGISGDQILQYLKNEKKRSIPVVGMSGTPWLLEKNDFDASLSKPCSLKETMEILCHLIKREK
jgi:CheY-like chemotaxis protein